MAEARSVREPWDGLAKRAVASILHDFYTGCERIFRRVALDLDGYFPDESNWHRRLLAAMASPLAEIRPAVISRELAATLDEYLGFRHVFRNIYGFELEGERLRRLAQGLEATSRRVDEELCTFVGWLKSRGA